MTYSWLVIAGAVVLMLIAGALIAWFRITRAGRAGRLGGHRLREGRSGRGGRGGRHRHRPEPAGGRRRTARIARVRAGLLRWRSAAGTHAAADRVPDVRDTDRFDAPRAGRTGVADVAREIGPNGPRLLVAATPAVALIVAVLPFTSGGGARAGVTWCVISLAFVAGSAVVLALLDHAYARPFGLTTRPDRPRPRHGRRPGRRRYRPAEPRLSPPPLPPSPRRTWSPDAARRPERSW